MIHLGAIVGRGACMMRSKTFGISAKTFSRFRSREDARDFLTAGTAAGVASAFGAPVGGVLVRPRSPTPILLVSSTLLVSHPYSSHIHPPCV